MFTRVCRTSRARRKSRLDTRIWRAFCVDTRIWRASCVDTRIWRAYCVDTRIWRASCVDTRIWRASRISHHARLPFILMLTRVSGRISLLSCLVSASLYHGVFRANLTHNFRCIRTFVVVNSTLQCLVYYSLCFWCL